MLICESDTKEIEEVKVFYKKLFRLGIPMALQTLMAALVGASDTLMLGFLNQGSLSAVSLATQVTFVLSLFTTAVTIGETMSLEIPLTIQWYQGFLLPGAIPDLVLSVMR